MTDQRKTADLLRKWIKEDEKSRKAVMKVWYSPEYDQLTLSSEKDAFIFKDEHGPFIVTYRDTHDPMKMRLVEWFYIGDFDNE